MYKNKDGSWTLTNKVDKLCHNKIYIQDEIDIAYTKLDWDNVAPLDFVEYLKEEK